MAKPDRLLHALLGFFFLVTLFWLLLHSCSLTFHCGVSEKFSSADLLVTNKDPLAYKNFDDSAFDTDAQEMYPLSCPKKQRAWNDPYPLQKDPLVREEFRSVAEEAMKIFH